MQHSAFVLRLLAAAVFLASCSPGGTNRAAQSHSGVAGTPASATPARTVQVTGATGDPPPTTIRAATPAGGTGSGAQPVALADLKIQLQPIAGGLRQPVHVTYAGDGSGRLFVVEKQGRIRVLRGGRLVDQPFLDITDRVGAQGSEQGLLSVAFHPRFVENGRLFVDYTDRRGDTVISRFQVRGDTADPHSEAVILRIDQPYPNHNGGLVLFGPDGYLYIGMGDGGSAGDPQNNAQNSESLLGKLLRIDVDHGEPYAIPPDNPWADGAARRGEIWALGLRNPWRFSFDRATGDLYIADVGQNAYEEVDWQPATSRGGENYGWRLAEGQHCYRGPCDLSRYVAPVAEYSRASGCSITGGFVYRGAAFPRMQGVYLFGDYCSGLMWALQQTAPGTWEQAQVLESNLRISSFGEDEAGELYLTSMSDGMLYRVTEREP